MAIILRGSGEVYFKRVADSNGPRFNEMFTTEDSYQATESALTTQVSKLFTDLDKVGVETLPANAKKYMGAFVLAGEAIPSLTEGPQNCYEIRFLSDHITALVAASCTEANKQALEKAGFDYLIAEFMLSQCLMVRGGDTLIDETWGMHKWRWYRNP